MKRSIHAVLVSIACGLLLMGCFLGGCAPSSNAGSANTEQQANRMYMSQVNEIMDEFAESFESMVTAVSEGDAVNIRNQANSAYAILDKLAELEAPEDLAGIKESYTQGTDKLREALDGYIALYTDIESGSFDQANYDSRLEEIQSTYDEGVEILRNGDADAAEL